MARHVARIFCESPLTSGASQRLGADAAHHLLHVLRIKRGADVILFDGSGGEFTAVIAETGRDWIEAQVGERRELASESALAITLGQGISRGERMDYTLQKAVEL